MVERQGWQAARAAAGARLGLLLHATHLDLVQRQRGLLALLLQAGRQAGSEGEL